MSEIQNTLSESNDIANLLSLALENLGYSNEWIIRYSFLIEEALLKWKNHGLAESQLCFSGIDRKDEKVFRWSIAGERCDPFSIDTDMVDTDPVVRMNDLLQSGVGAELKYKYRNGENIVTLTLPTKDPDRRLFNRNLTALAIPIGFQALIVAIASYIDSFMLGFLDSDAMSAVSQVAQFVLTQSLLITACEISATAIISKLWSNRDRKGLSSLIGVAMKVSFLLSSLFFILSFFLPDKVMAFYTDIPELAAYGTTYLRIVSFSFLACPVFRVMYSLMRATGRAGKCLLYSIAGSTVNVILNAVFIFGLAGCPRLGVTGAAIATVASSLLQLILAIAGIVRIDGIHISLHRSADVSKDFMKRFIPMCAQFMIWCVATNIISAAFGHMNSDIMAANSLITIVTGMVTCLKTGVATGCGILMGGYLGKGDSDRTWKMSRVMLSTGAKWAVLCAVLLSVTVIAATFLPIDLSNDAKRYTYFLIAICSVNIFFSFMNAIINQGALYAGNDTKSVLLIDTAVMWCILVPVAVAGTYFVTIPVIIMLVVLRIDEVLSFPLKYRRYLSARWLKGA